ncbi:NIPSNAP family protein [Rhodovibrionaceae bacterium A322]
MIIDHRVYSFKPLTVPTFLKVYETYGYPVQIKYLGKPIGWYVTEHGEQNSVVHLWQFESVEDRAQKRAAMMQDPDWLDYLAKVRDLDILLKQSSNIVQPASFFTPYALPNSD